VHCGGEAGRNANRYIPPCGTEQLNFNKKYGLQQKVLGLALAIYEACQSFRHPKLQRSQYPDLCVVKISIHIPPNHKKIYSNHQKTLRKTRRTSLKQPA
jgi:hypothetical protein